MTRPQWFQWLAVAVAMAPMSATSKADEPGLPDASGNLLEAVSHLAPGETRRESSANPDLNRNGDAKTIQPGEALTLAELSGPGAITHFWNTVGARNPFAGRLLVLRIYWDGDEKPSVQVPLGDFFGVGHGASADLSSLPVTVTSLGRSRSCYWRMPFRKSARVTVTNDGGEPVTFYYYLDWEQLTQLPEPVLYFHAEYRQAMPATPGDYTILDTIGQGNYVGTVYSAQQMHLGWFGEGDDRFYIDGESEPRLRGTGTEDYFNDAWGFRAFAAPFFGVSLWEGYFPGDRSTAYRWHLPDPIRFASSLKVTIEHRGSLFSSMGIQKDSFAERNDWLSSVAFWYQTPVRGIGTELPPFKDRIAPYRILAASSLERRAKPAWLLTQDETTVTYVPARDDAEIEFDFALEQKGSYQLSATLVHSVLGGQYQAYLDGKEVGPVIDCCYPGHDPVWVGFDLHDLSSGDHTLSFRGRGASPHMRTKTPKAYGFGMQHLILLRLEDMEGYKP